MNRHVFACALLSALAFGVVSPVPKSSHGSSRSRGRGPGRRGGRTAAPDVGGRADRRGDGLADLGCRSERALATLAIAWRAYREPVDRRLPAGALAMVAGGVLLAASGPARLDAVAPLAAACVYRGNDDNVGLRLSLADPVALATVVGLVAGCANRASGWTSGAGWPSATAPGLGLVLGFVACRASIVRYLRAQRDLGAARAAAGFGLAPGAGASIAVIAHSVRGPCAAS